MNPTDILKFIGAAVGVVKVGLPLVGEGGAKTVLEAVVDFIGESAAKNHIDQYAAARLAADAAEKAKFGE
jgi:orotidine-5'-phosphate decarboxylase